MTMTTSHEGLPDGHRTLPSDAEAELHGTVQGEHHRETPIEQRRPKTAGMMRTFVLRRNQDVSGVSGTGIVAEGVIFYDGTVALCWYGGLGGVGIHRCISTLLTIHGHNGATVVDYGDGEPA